MASGDIHLIGSILFFLEWYTFPAYTLRDNPKSATFTNLLSQTRTFLAARSRWTNPFFDRNSYAREENKFSSLQQRLLIKSYEKEYNNLLKRIYLRVRFLKKAQDWILKSKRIRKLILRFCTEQINPRFFGSWSIKGTENCTSIVNFSVPSTHHDPRDLELICL